MINKANDQNKMTEVLAITLPKPEPFRHGKTLSLSARGSCISNRIVQKHTLLRTAHLSSGGVSSSAAPAILRIVSCLLHKLLHLSLLLFHLPTLLGVVGRLPHELLLFRFGDFDEAAAVGHV